MRSLTDEGSRRKVTAVTTFSRTRKSAAPHTTSRRPPAARLRLTLLYGELAALSLEATSAGPLLPGNSSAHHREPKSHNYSRNQRSSFIQRAISNSEQTGKSRLRKYVSVLKTHAPEHTPEHAPEHALDHAPDPLRIMLRITLQLPLRMTSS